MTFTGLCKSPFSPRLTLPCQENINLPRRVEIQQGWRVWDLRVCYRHTEGKTLWAPAPSWHLHCAPKRCLQREGHLPAEASQLPGGQRPVRAKKRGTQASPGRAKCTKPSKMVCIGFAITKCLMVIQTKNECIRLFSTTSLQPRKFFCIFFQFCAQDLRIEPQRHKYKLKKPNKKPPLTGSFNMYKGTKYLFP